MKMGWIIFNAIATVIVLACSNYVYQESFAEQANYAQAVERSWFQFVAIAIFTGNLCFLSKTDMYNREQK